MCLGAVMWANISKMYYACTSEEAAAIGFDDRTFYEAFSNPQSNKLLTVEHRDDPRCHSLFQKWLELDHRVIY
jgi:guanine deaminase